MKIINTKINHPAILGLGMLLYIIFLTALCWYKYSQFGYNALDLAIYNNAFFNATLHGYFWSSIQGHLYFADHFEPLLYLFLPLYWLWKSPLNLLLLQSIVIASSALPIYKISTLWLNKKIATLLALAWLINPLAWNINLHEWHLLPLAIPLLLLAFYYYEKKYFWWHTLFIFIALLVREDVAVAVFGFFLLALYEKKSWRWWLTPLMLAGGYFLIANYFINFWQAGGSRFQVYYQWLFDSSLWQIFLHFFTIGNFEMILGLLLAFIFLPLFAKKYLLLLIGPLAQFMLGEPGGSNLIVDTHYASLFIPGLIIASIYGWRNIYTKKIPISKIVFFDKKLSFLIITVILIYLPLFLGPGIGIIRKTLSANDTNWQKKLLNNLPASASLASGYKYLPYISSRENIASLHYIFIGQQQFSDLPYTYTQPDFILIDPQDFITYALQFSNSKFYKSFYPASFTNLERLLAQNYELAYFHPELMIWKKSKISSQFEYSKPFTINDHKQQIADNIYLNFTYEKNLLHLDWNYTKKDNKNYFLQVTTKQSKYLRPLSLFTSSLLWQENNTYHSLLPVTPEEKQINLQLMAIEGNIELDDWRGIKNNINLTPIGEATLIEIN
jgi:uncharacterized membrane protein